MNVLPSLTQLRRISSPSASTCVTTMLAGTSVPAVQAMSFRRMGILARVRTGGVGGRQRLNKGLLGQPDRLLVTSSLLCSHSQVQQ